MEKTAMRKLRIWILPVLLLLTASLILLLSSCGGETDKTYSVTFRVDGVDTVVSVKSGETPAFTGTPTKPDDEENAYVFSGWEPALAPASADVTYTASFTAVRHTTYTVDWYIGTEHITTQVRAGRVPTPPTVEEEKITPAEIIRFTGWDKEITAVTEDHMTYRAKLDTTPRSFTVTFRVDGEPVLTKQFLYGEMIEYPAANPSKEGLRFAKWTNSGRAAADTVCDAIFTKYNYEQLEWARKYQILLAYPADYEATGSMMTSSSALLYMLLEEHENPTSGVYCDRILEHLRYFISGGKEPKFTAGPFWHYATISMSIAMARHTPTVWSRLTAEEQAKYDLIMACYAVDAAFMTDDDNNYSTGTTLTGNHNKGWNPNHRLGMTTPIVAATMYFNADGKDGATLVNDLLLNFDVEAYKAKFVEYGFTRALASWSTEGYTFENGTQAPGASELLMNGGKAFIAAVDSGTNTIGKKLGDAMGEGVGVRTTYTYHGYGLDNLPAIMNHMYTYNYSGGVVVSDTAGMASGLDENGKPKAYIMDGTKSPMEGQLGMMREFMASDGGGIRSTTTYCAHDLTLVTQTMAAMMSLGEYELPLSSALFRLMWVGNTDTIYKLEHGYHGYSLGKGYDVTEASLGESIQPWKCWWKESFGWLELDDLALAEDAVYDFDLTTPLLSRNGYSPEEGELFDLIRSELAYSGSNALRAAFVHNWNRGRLLNVFDEESVGKTYRISFRYYVESIPSTTDASFLVRIEKNSSETTDGFGAQRIAVSETGKWVEVVYYLTFTEEMRDAEAYNLVFRFDKMGVSDKPTSLLLDDISILTTRPIDYELNGGAVDTDLTEAYIYSKEEQTLTLPTPTHAYADFTGWFVDEAGTLKALSDGSVSIEGSVLRIAPEMKTAIRIYAVFVIPEGTPHAEIRYNAPIGTKLGGTYSDAYYDVNADVTLGLPEFDLDGFVFEGWYTNPGYSGDPLTSLFISAEQARQLEPINLYAKCHKIIFERAEGALLPTDTNKGFSLPTGGGKRVILDGGIDKVALSQELTTDKTIRLTKITGRNASGGNGADGYWRCDLLSFKTGVATVQMTLAVDGANPLCPSAFRLRDGSSVNPVDGVRFSSDGSVKVGTGADAVTLGTRIEATPHTFTFIIFGKGEQPGFEIDVYVDGVRVAERISYSASQTKSGVVVSDFSASQITAFHWYFSTSSTGSMILSDLKLCDGFLPGMEISAPTINP